MIHVISLKNMTIDVFLKGYQVWYQYIRFDEGIFCEFTILYNPFYVDYLFNSVKKKIYKTKCMFIPLRICHFLIHNNSIFDIFYDKRSIFSNIKVHLSGEKNQNKTKTLTVLQKQLKMLFLLKECLIGRCKFSLAMLWSFKIGF